MTDSTDLLRMKMQRQRGDARARAVGELIMLKMRIETMIEAFEANKPVEETLIQNAMGLAHLCAQYNTALDILPMLEDYANTEED